MYMLMANDNYRHMPHSKSMYMLMLYDDCHYTLDTPRLIGESMYMSRSSSNYRRVPDYVVSEKIIYSRRQ